ncbi:hypothetical protein J3R83DRAFT_11950 [Lanmaoa asiatica]|nr:hypothetical protein J3R83DRAFT_11950 [Lanmaoa asiatica]
MTIQQLLQVCNYCVRPIRFSLVLIIIEVAEWPYTFTPIGTALAALVTQIYLGFRHVYRIFQPDFELSLCCRIWRLTGSKILYGVVIALAIPSFILGMTCAIKAWIIKVLSELPRITPLVIAWLSMQFVVDTFITTTLTIIFSRSRTGFRKTDTILNRLTRGAIQTGLFAGIFSMGDLITFIVLPNTNLYGMFAIPIGRIYTNTLLDTLLTRETLKGEMVGTYDVSGGTGPIGWAPPDSSLATSTVQSSSIQLKVQKTVQEMYDRSSCEDMGGKIIPLAV